MNINKRVSLLWRRARVLLSILICKLTGRRVPVVVYLYPTYKCNLRCVYCLVDHSVEVKEMDKGQLLRLVDELAEMGTRMIVFLGGEFSIVKGIEDVIDRIIEKGMICDAVTNAILLPKKLDLFKKMDSLCISMDGIGTSNDITRGKGTSEKILNSIRIAKKEGISVRINCVITKYNRHTYRQLLEWAKGNNLLVTFGMPFEDEIKDMLLDEDDMKQFYRELVQLKKDGYPVLFSYEAIDHMLNYPGSPSEFIMKAQAGDANIDKRYKKRCPYGSFIAYIHSDGMLLPCNNLYKLRRKGVNIWEAGLKNAWDSFAEIDCLSCYEAGIPEWNFLTSLKGILKGISITLK